jgi:hypothetical protein
MEKRCHDCSCKIGEYHAPGCDMEECPFCHSQLISCDCCYELLGIDSSKEPVYSQGLNDIQGELWQKKLEEKGFIKYGDETRFNIIKETFKIKESE